MFYNDKNKSYINHWFRWAEKGIEREELFQDVRQLVEDMIKQILPQAIEEHLNGLTIDVETRINGKTADLSGLKGELEQIIVDELINGLR